MHATNFNLRGLSSEVMATLKREAEKQNISVNSLILTFIRNSIGYSHTVKKPTHHDLDQLAGTWSAMDAEEFAVNTENFEKIDEDLWS